MKRKIFSVMAVFLVCCSALFMLVGCNSASDKTKLGTLTASVGATKESPAIFLKGYTVEEALRYVTFTFIPAEGAVENVYNKDTGKMEKQKVEKWTSLSYKDAKEKGLTVFSIDTSTVTTKGPRVLVCGYLQTSCKIYYNVI